MLSQLRKGVSTWIAKIFIGILILSFAVWGVSGIALTSTSNTLAEVGDVEVTRQDFEKLYPSVVNEWNQRLQQRLNRQQIRLFKIPEQVLNRLVNQAVVENHARKLNLGVSDAQIGKVITNDPQLRDATGQFNKELLKQVLREERITEEQYFNAQREVSQRRQITSLFSTKRPIPDVLINSMYRHREDKLKVAYFQIPDSAAKKPEAPDEGTLKDYYETTKGAYEAPEFRKVALYVLSVEALKKEITPSEEDIKATYEARKKNYVTPATRTFDQILFENKAKADEAHAALKKGESFEKVAKDFGEGGKTVSVGPVTVSAMADKKLAESVFALKKDEYSEPITGTFATVILKIKEATERVEKPLKDVRTEIEDLLKAREASKKIKSLYDQVEDLRAGGMSVIDVAKEMDGAPLVFENMSVRGQGPDGKAIKDMPPTKRLAVSVFEAAVGDDTVPVRHQDGGYVWFDVLKITPKRIKTFDEVKDKVKENWLAKETKQAQAEFASETEKRIKGGEDFNKVAASLKAKVVTPDAVGRGAVAKDIPVSFVNQLFTVKTGEVTSGLGEGNKSWLVVKVLDRVAAKTEGPAFEAYRKKLIEELRTEITDDMVQEYLKRAKSSYKVEENKQLFDQIINGL